MTFQTGDPAEVPDRVISHLIESGISRSWHCCFGDLCGEDSLVSRFLEQLVINYVLKTRAGRLKQIVRKAISIGTSILSLAGSL